MNGDKFRQSMVVAATLVMITVNALANILPINGLNTGAVSDQFKVYFVPAGYVFSIWGLIYAAVIAYTIYQALASKKEDTDLRKIGWWYVIGSLANSVWIFLWHYQLFSLTLVMMFLLLASLIIIYIRSGIGRKKASPGKRLCVYLPFSLYLGWITVATIANVTDVLHFVGWNGFGLDPKLWAVIMLAAGVVIAALMAFTRRDLVFLAVLVWAFIGIGAKFKGVSPVYEAAYLAAACVILLGILSMVIKPRRKNAEISI